MNEKIYPFEEFFDVLQYLDFDLNDILDFEEYYQNLNKPIKNFEDFIKFNDEKGLTNKEITLKCNDCEKVYYSINKETTICPNCNGELEVLK